MYILNLGQLLTVPTVSKPHILGRLVSLPVISNQHLSLKSQLVAIVQSSWYNDFMTTNYQLGANRERQAVRELTERGYFNAQRSAGSHGIFDVYAFCKDHVLFVQVKSTKEDAAGAIRAIMEAPLPISDCIRYEVWEKLPRGHGWKITQVE